MTLQIGKLHTLNTRLETASVEQAMDGLEKGTGTVVFNEEAESRLAASIREAGKSTRRTFSQVAIVQFKDRTVLLSDGFVHPQPDIKTMTAIIQNAIATARKAGIDAPKVAVLSAVELVSPQMDSAVPAAVMEAMGNRGQFGNGVAVEGPLSMDVSLSEKAAEEKHVDTPVAGKANILIGHMATVPAGILSGWIRFASPESVISVLTDGKSWHPFLLAGMSGKQIEQTLAFCEVE